MDNRPGMRGRMPTALALMLGATVASLISPPPALTQADPDRAELVEDLALGFPVTINLGTCTEVLPTPSFVIGNADPAALLSLENEPRPLLDDQPGEDELVEDGDAALLAEEGGQLDAEDVTLLGEGATPPAVVWQAEEEIPVELETLFLEPHVVIVHSRADEPGSYVACGEIGDDLIAEGELAVPIRQIAGSAFAGVALLEEQSEGFLGFEDEETDVEIYLFHGLNAPTGQATPTPEASPAAPADAAPTATSEAEATATPAPEAPSPTAAASPSPAASPPASPEASPAATEAPAEDKEAAESRTIEMVDIDFNPNELTIPADTPVELVFPNNGQVLHNFSLDEKNNEELPIEPIDVDVQPGEQQSVTVNLPPGDYYFYCDIAGHEAAGMFGTLHVEAQ